MQFTYHPNCSNQLLQIEEDIYKYLFKARRHKVGDEIYFRNLNDDFLYLYKVVSIDRRKALCEFLSKEEKILKNNKKLHLAWCVLDPKIVEKSIASLNELGVDKITFIYCEYSQCNFKISFERLEKILVNSSSQCGRSSIISLETSNSLEEFLKQYPNTYFLDFSSTNIESKKDDIETLLIGCEGGFSNKERASFDKKRVVGFDSDLILKSETAAICAASKILV